MDLRRVMLWAIGLIVAGTAWGNSSASGAYLARGPGFAELLQITETKDGRVMGTLTHAVRQPDGTVKETQDGLTGAVDGRSITLVISAPLSLGASMSGTVEGNLITLVLPSGSEHFAAAQPTDYQAAVQKLKAEGAVMQQRQAAADREARRLRQLREQNDAVADLNRRLTEYAGRVTSPKADAQDKAIRDAHEKALAQARQLWTKEQSFPRGSYQAGQVAFAIGQVSFRLESFDNPLEDLPNVGRDHVKQYDGEITNSVCRHHPDASLSHCFEQDAAVQAYQAARPVVLKRMDDLAATLSADKAAMKSVVDEADEYSRSK
jgi:hypothetical protein